MSRFAKLNLLMLCFIFSISCGTAVNAHKEKKGLTFIFVQISVRYNQMPSIWEAEPKIWNSEEDCEDNLMKQYKTMVGYIMERNKLDKKLYVHNGRYDDGKFMDLYHIISCSGFYMMSEDLYDFMK